ncbi:hypothetical protein [Aestuariimicrobium ganziense]|uniref:hypothetical protein n=1 Tax=Aestuariimicrobium ganziense TaxID=2773677 RepID=UPI0019422159|nr:hypothetical protein [Aestuariimicrobium ganziense]
MPRRATTMAVAAVGALALGLGGWAVAHEASQPEVPAQQAVNVLPADQPGKTDASNSVPGKNVPGKKGQHEVPPELQALAGASIEQLATKLDRTPEQLKAAAEKVKSEVVPTQAEGLRWKTGTETDREALAKLYERRAMSVAARELKVTPQALAKAINEVKDETVASNEAMIEAKLAEAVKQGKITQAEADEMLTKVKETKIGG